MDALHAIRHRRAVRRYTHRPVPEEDVAGLLRLALHAPTGHGAQAWGFVVVRDPERRLALAELVLRGAAEYFRTFRPPGEGVTDEPALRAYHLLPSVRGDLLAKLGRRDEARVEFERAASMTRNTRERDLLLARAADCI